MVMVAFGCGSRSTARLKKALPCSGISEKSISSSRKASILAQLDCETFLEVRFFTMVRLSYRDDANGLRLRFGKDHRYKPLANETKADLPRLPVIFSGVGHNQHRPTEHFRNVHEVYPVKCHLCIVNTKCSYVNTYSGRPAASVDEGRFVEIDTHGGEEVKRAKVEKWPARFSSRGWRGGGGCQKSVVGVFVSLDQFQHDHLLAWRIHVVEDAVRADPQPILREELRNHHVSLQLLAAFASRPRIEAEAAYCPGNGGLVIGGDLLQRLLERTLDSFARKDNGIGHSVAHLPEQPFNRDGFPLCVLGAGQGDFLQQLLVLQFLQHLQQVQHLVVGHQEGDGLSMRQDQ